jgi:hypothetical protein
MEGDDAISQVWRFYGHSICAGAAQDHISASVSRKDSTYGGSRNSYVDI